MIRNLAKGAAGIVDSILARFLILFVRLYQLTLGPLFGNCCRFYPSCSQYALMALRRHGAFRGTMLAAWRLLRCNPFNPGGVDEVPEPGEWRARVKRGASGFLERLGNADRGRREDRWLSPGEMEGKIRTRS